VLKGGRPGPVVALRSELDALPVTEEVDLPFRSTVQTEYAGQTTGVMHACGHDAHMAILLGTAAVLAGMRAELPGTVKVIFQPAEEGAPEGEDYGARRMVHEGVLSTEPRPSAIFGLHVMSFADVGTIGYRSGGLMAGSDDFKITVHGRQTHGAMPWGGVDPIVVAAQIVSAIQTIPSRMMDVTRAPIVVTVGSIHGGIKSNIIPDTVTLVGTIRALDPKMLASAHERLVTLAEETARASGASATVEIDPLLHYDVTYNDPELTQRMLPTLRQVVGDRHVVEAQPTTGGEDFSAFQREIPGLFVILGARTPGADPATFPPNHSPRFRIDESVLGIGVRTLSHLAVDYLTGGPSSP
jgi:amidohydrolase